MTNNEKQANENNLWRVVFSENHWGKKRTETSIDDIPMYVQVPTEMLCRQSMDIAGSLLVFGSVRFTPNVTFTLTSAYHEISFVAAKRTQHLPQTTVLLLVLC